MKKIFISDITLRECESDAAVLSFKEKIEIFRKLDKLCVDVIEISQIKNKKTDILFLHTVSPLAKNSIVSCMVDYSEKSVEMTYDAIKDAPKKRLHLAVPSSSVQMEYLCKKKPDKVFDMAKALLEKCVSLCDDVEFSLLDATRSEKPFLYKMLKMAVQCGVKTITVCDSTGETLPDEMCEFINDIYKNVPELENIVLSAECKNTIGMGAACMISSIPCGISQIKTATSGMGVPSLLTVSEIIRARGDSMKIATNLKTTEISSVTSQILSLTEKQPSYVSSSAMLFEPTEVTLGENDDINTVSVACKKLGYELSEDDIKSVYEEFVKVASKKKITSKELDAIIASASLQVSPTYKLVGYVINSSNVFASSAHITLERDGKSIDAIATGDGPIDAAFITIEKLLARHFELDDFQIQSVTEGKEAMGHAVVKLRSEGKLYSGRGISTDIIGASINAYINAINKIYFDEA